MKQLLFILPAAFALMLSSCTDMSPKGPTLAEYQAYDRPATLPTNRSNVRVKVSLQNQMAYVMEGDRPLLITPVGVGAAETPTPQGSFRIFGKNATRRAYTHGLAVRGNEIQRARIGSVPKGFRFVGTPMPYWCEFKPAYGFHTGWVKPYPSTNGCLRLHENVAPKFFRLVSNGTPVSISRTQPEDATIGRNIPRPPNSDPIPNYPVSMYIGDGFFSQHKTPTYVP